MNICAIVVISDDTVSISSEFSIIYFIWDATIKKENIMVKI
jgi:hypothetical protein